MTDRNGSIINVETTPALKYINIDNLPAHGSVHLSIDATASNILDAELAKGIDRFQAKAGLGLIFDVNSGEVIALSSLDGPDTPVDFAGARPSDFNRVMQGVYAIEPALRAATIAMALDAGRVNLTSRINVKKDILYGRYRITDAYAQRRVLMIPEIFTYSSNIGAARVARIVGPFGHKSFLSKVGMLDKIDMGLMQTADLVAPKKWTLLQTLNTSFGHDFLITPLHAAVAISALVNGGKMVHPTILKSSDDASADRRRQVIKAKTSKKIRYLLRLNAEIGAARVINIPGILTGGMSGTERKIFDGQSPSEHVTTTFVAVFPSNKPEYFLMVMLDDPKGIPQTQGYTTAAWNTGFVASEVIKKVASLLKPTETGASVHDARGRSSSQ